MRAALKWVWDWWPMLAGGALIVGFASGALPNRVEWSVENIAAALVISFLLSPFSIAFWRSVIEHFRGRA